MALSLSLFLTATATAAPLPTEVLPSEPGVYRVEVALEGGVLPAGVDPDLVLEAAAGAAPEGTLHVEVVSRDPETGVLRTLESPGASAVPAKDGGVYRSLPSALPGIEDGELSGKAIYLSQCHGWIYYDTLGRFSTQRGNLFETVEDFHNPEGANHFLTAYLENAGAMVYTTKERDLNPNMAIADNDGEGYSESGSGFGPGPDGNQGFADASRFRYGEDPFNSGTTRRFPADGGAVATWIPEVPVDDWYAVYVSWDAHAEHASDAHYRITHPGGVIDRTFDQRVHGSTWQYVDTLWLREGVDDFKVELVGDSSDAGSYLSADAVRIGGGMGQVERFGMTTGRPRWEEGAILYAQYNGAPTSVYDPYGSGDGSDPAVRSRWAAWEHPAGEDAIYLSWHSNAGGGVGTSVYTYEGTAGVGTPGSIDLAELLVDEIVTASRALWDAGWTNRGHRTGAFAEVNPSHNNEMPAALIELAFHDSATDVVALKSPSYRRDASRAMYRAITRYFAERDGRSPVFLPEPPTAVGLVHNASGQLEARWEPGLVGNPFGDAATSYRLYTSRDGLAWDSGREVSGTSAVVSAAPGEAVFVRVVGLNAGGASFPSQIAGARRASGGSAQVLVVEAFDRLDNGLLLTRDAGTLGTVKGLDLTRMNRGDSAAIHGRAIAGAGFPFDTVTDDVFDDLDLGPYTVVVWAAGEESTSDETLTTAQQAKVRAFWQGGGKIWVSGAEVLWDLDYRGSADDKAFAAEVLGATMASDDAGTTDAIGTGLLDGVGLLDFGEADGAPYPVEFPDVLSTSRPVIATYAGGAVAAAYGDGVALFGFPFETVGDPSVREEVARRLLGDMLDGGRDTGPFGGGDGDTGTGSDGSFEDPRESIPASAGCGCAVRTGTAGAFWLALPLMLALRRRR